MEWGWDSKPHTLHASNSRVVRYQNEWDALICEKNGLLQTSVLLYRFLDNKERRSVNHDHSTIVESLFADTTIR